ncbi:hypothetical protein G9A89_010825 [Geosiphon pyriformis]|nr:hypothetical protein G9A89_010825 [Geosiphon pyriformis]
MELVGFSAGGSNSVSARLETQSNNKKKVCIESIYSRGPLYKKSKISGNAGGIVNSLAGPIPDDVSWSSEMESKDANVAKVSDLENIDNMMAEETSYKSSFNVMSDINNILELLSSKFQDSNQLLSAKSCILKKRSFEPVKSFVLDIELLAVSRKNVSEKLILIKKIFYQVDGFGGASTSSKFTEIIRSSFTSELSLNKAKELAICEKILVNNDVKKLGIHSNQEIIVKEIPVDLSRSAIESVFAKFGKIVSIKMQLIGLWQKALVKFESPEFILMGKNSVWVVLAVEDKQSWVFRNQYRALLYTLPVGTTVHDFSYVCDRCAVVCFADKESKLATIGSNPVFKGVNFVNKLVTSLIHVYLIHLAGIYKKKQAPIVCPVFFGGRTWAQVAGGFFSYVAFLVSCGASLFLVVETSLFASVSPSNCDVYGCLASLECFLKLLADQVSGILKKLGSIKLVLLITTFDASPPVVPVSVVSGLDLNIVLDGVSAIFNPSPPVISDTASVISSSSSKVLTTKVSGLESKMMALKISVESVLEKLDCLCSGLSSVLVWKIAMCNIRGMNNPAKQDDIICWHKKTNNLISIVIKTKLKSKICPWIMNKFDDVWVFTSGLDSGYVGSGIVIVMNISLAKHVCKVSEMPGWLLSIKLLFKNKLFVSILGLYAGASSMVQFSQAGEVNSFIAKTINESSFVVLGGDFNEDSLRKSVSFKRCLDLGLPSSEKFYMEKFERCKKTIDFVLVSSNLVNAVVDCNVVNANRDHWKFDFRNADDTRMFANEFAATIQLLNLDIMWNVLCKIMTLSANKIFRKKWFKDFDGVFTRNFSRFHRLKLLVSKLVKASCLVSSVEFFLFLSSSNFDMICSALAKVRKSYCFSKLLEFRRAKKTCIKAAINKRMESFESDKGHIIRSVLEHLFCKVVLDHLVVNDELVLEPSLVKSRVDGIMEGWTRKCRVMPDILNEWSCQYWPLKYVFDNVFSDVMCPVGVDKLLGVIFDLPKGKVAGLFRISNELWKHCNRSILDMLLVLLNSCLIHKSVPISMIPKLYKWNKIFSKILSDRISLACSIFDVLHENNFSVLRMVKNTLEKGHELWLAYDSVGWKHLGNSLVRIKMCNRFIRFFGGIHNNYINRVMTDFGLMDKYRVHNGLDQKKVFLPLFWHIFYDFLLCEVKKQVNQCKYKLNSYFISRYSRAKFQAGLFSFFAVGAFTVTIPINCKVADSSLLISESPISIAKRGKSHCYLGIYLSTEGLSKPSLAKAHSDVRFFANLVFKKTVSNKQFLYLVSAVLFLIIGYRTQFNYVSVSAFKKWDTLICKGLKSKSGLLCDFPSNAIHYSSLYGLKTFKQIQTENKLASIISFTNSVSILGYLFFHWLHNLQVLCWCPFHSLQYPVYVKVNPLNNFLADMMCIFFGSDLSLGGSLTNAFCHRNGTLMSSVLGKSTYFKCVFSLQHYRIAFWKWLDPHSPVLVWFELSVCFLGSAFSFSVYFSSLDNGSSSNVLCSCEFSAISANLLCSDVGHLSVYMDGLLSGLGSVDMKARAAVFFKDIGMDLGAIALALECVPFSHSINLFLNSQAALDAYNKNLNVNWYKVKSHLGVLGNIHVDELARAAALFSWTLPHSINECYLRVGSTAISGSGGQSAHGY